MRRVQPWCRSSCTLVPVWCSGNCRNCARASCRSWCGDTRGLCAQQWFGWVTNVFDYRSNGEALCCGLIHQHRFVYPPRTVVPSLCSACTAVRTVLRKYAHQMHAAVDSGCNENPQLMCELSNRNSFCLTGRSVHFHDVVRFPCLVIEFGAAAVESNGDEKGAAF